MKNFILPYTTALILGIMPLLSQAKVLTIDEAMARMRSNGPAFVAGDKYQLAKTFLDTNGEAAFYAVNLPQQTGWIILSAEDSTTPMLAYGDERFWPDVLPEAMVLTLEAYAQEIQTMRDNGSDPYTSDSSLDSSVAPLLGQIAWEQNSPYNDLCPTYYGNVRAATGCAATAMAQIMYYHRWPDVGEGIHTFTPLVNSSIGELTVDYSQSQYAWDAMLPTYDEDSPEDARLAVAKLMYDCGVAISMDYGEESGAYSINWCEALTTHFRYDQGVHYRLRNNYSIVDWEGAIRGDLNQGLPVYVTGYTPEGGHAFVFDGYDNQGLFHVNWGWSGMGNGYFRTTALTPYELGIGGSAGGFNSKQLVITGIKPADDGSEPALSLVSDEALRCTPSKIGIGESTTVKLNGRIYNAGWRDAQFDLGLGIYTEDGLLLEVIEGPTDFSLSQDEAMFTVDYGQVYFPEITEGEYKLHPICRWNGGVNWEKIRDTYVGLPNALNMSVSDNVIKFSSPGYYSLTAESLTVNAPIMQSDYSSVTAVITNQGESEYYGSVKLALYDATTRKKVAEGEAYIIDLMPGQSDTIDFEDVFNVDPGIWLLSVIDEDNMRLHDYIEVEIIPYASIESILANPDRTIEIFSLDGRLIPTNATPAPGIYIMVEKVSDKYQISKYIQQ